MGQLVLYPLLIIRNSSKLRNALGFLTHFTVYGKSALKHFSHDIYNSLTNIGVYINIYPLTA